MPTVDPSSYPDPFLDGSTLSFDGLPEGTVVRITEPSGEERLYDIADGPWLLGEGVHALRVEPPYPWAARLVVVSAPALSSEALDRVKVTAVAGVNKEIGQLRARHLTNLPGQEMIYLQKQREAETFLIQGGPASIFPLLMAEVNAGNVADLAEAAQLIGERAVFLLHVAAGLETIRLGTLRHIGLATTMEELSAVLIDFRATMDALADAA